jgi:hypothetical protein
MTAHQNGPFPPLEVLKDAWRYDPSMTIETVALSFNVPPQDLRDYFEAIGFSPPVQSKTSAAANRMSPAGKAASPLNLSSGRVGNRRVLPDAAAAPAPETMHRTGSGTEFEGTVRNKCIAYHIGKPCLFSSKASSGCAETHRMLLGCDDDYDCCMVSLACGAQLNLGDVHMCL